MKIAIKSLIFAFLCSLLVSVLTPIAYADTQTQVASQKKYSAKAAYLYSYDAKRVLYSQGLDEEIAPASTAKMMAGLVACEFFADKLDKKVSVTSEMISELSGTSMGLKSGMSVSIKDLIYGTICGGNNDAATVLAYACSGSVRSFVKEMNDYAALLDMRHTNYSNPTGMDTKDAQTTLSDTAKLAAKAASNKLYLDISSTPSYKLSDTITVYNRNALISQFSAQGYLNKNAKGLIAGSTDKGGYVVATVVQKNDRSFLCVVMGATADENGIYSYEIANDLINSGLKNYSYTMLGHSGKQISALPVQLALNNQSTAKIGCVLSEDVYTFLPDDADISQVTAKTYFYTDSLTAPIDKNTVVGGVDFYYDGTIVGRGTIVTAESVSANPLLLFLENMKSALFSRMFLFTVFFVVALTLLYLFLSKKSYSRKKANKYRFKRYR